MHSKQILKALRGKLRRRKRPRRPSVPAVRHRLAIESMENRLLLSAGGIGFMSFELSSAALDAHAVTSHRETPAGDSAHGGTQELGGYVDLGTIDLSSNGSKDRVRGDNFNDADFNGYLLDAGPLATGESTPGFELQVIPPEVHVQQQRSPNQLVDDKSNRLTPMPAEGGPVDLMAVLTIPSEPDAKGESSTEPRTSFSVSSVVNQDRIHAGELARAVAFEELNSADFGKVRPVSIPGKADRDGDQQSRPDSQPNVPLFDPPLSAQKGDDSARSAAMATPVDESARRAESVDGIFGDADIANADVNRTLADPANLHPFGEGMLPNETAAVYSAAFTDWDETCANFSSAIVEHGRRHAAPATFLTVLALDRLVAARSRFLYNRGSEAVNEPARSRP